MWLIAWRSRLYSLCLILLVANFYLITIYPLQIDQLESSSTLALSGWAISQTLEHRAGPVSWSSQATKLTFAEIKILTTCSWLAVTAWAIFTFYLSFDLFPDSGPTYQWLQLLFSSHKLVAGLRRERSSWLALLHQQANTVLDLQQTVQLATFDHIQQQLLSPSQSQQELDCKKLPASPLSPDQNQQELDCKKPSISPLPCDQEQSQQELNCKKLPASPLSPDQLSLAVETFPEQADSQVSSRLQELPSKQERLNSSPITKPEQEMVDQLAKLVVDLPIGSNLGMFHFLWMMVTGQLLTSRGAIFPALQAIGLRKEAVRRAWAAFNSKSWRIETLLATWQDQVITNDEWKERSYQGYRAKAVDLTAFWRPTVQNCQTSHYDSRARRALPAVVLGVCARVGDINGQRVPLPTDFVRSDQDDPSEKQLERRLIQKLKQMRADDEIHIFDAGFDLSMLIELALNGWIIRLPKNFVGRRNEAKAYCGKGTHPKYGEQVRPLGRQSRTRWIEADQADQELSFKEGKFEIKVELWKDLVQNSDLPGAKSFNVMAFHDPRYKTPWLLATDVKQLTAQNVRLFYKDRWPVEQLPLAAKQMIGAHRQFVWSDENIQRLPELSLLAGSVLTHVAASGQPIPTGFWDRAPKATPGRLRRYLNLFSLDRILANLPLPARIRKKESRTDHLKTGYSERELFEMQKEAT